MKSIFIILCSLLSILCYGQFATEQIIPFALDTDGNMIPNVVDTDDDNDGVLDILDAFPLNVMLSTPATSTLVITTGADAGCRSNGANGTRNFGKEPTSDLNNSNARYQILKFTKPVLTGIGSATLTIHSNTENDPLQIYMQADNSWVEGTGTVAAPTTDGVTHTSNAANFASKTLLGYTLAPTGTMGNYTYTFTLPLNALAVSGDFTLIVLDASNDGTIESVFDRETPGKAASIEFNYLTPVAPRLVVTQTTNDTTYIASSPHTVSFALSQAPISTMYIPLAISDTTKSNIVGDKVLVFTTANWNMPQVKQ